MDLCVYDNLFMESVHFKFTEKGKASGNFLIERFINPFLKNC